MCAVCNVWCGLWLCTWDFEHESLAYGEGVRGRPIHEHAAGVAETGGGVAV